MHPDDVIKKEQDVPKQQEMTVEQALQNLATVTADVKATRQEHLIIQVSLQTIANFIVANRKVAD